MGRLIIILLLVFGGACPGHPPVHIPVLEMSIQPSGIYVLSCSPYSTKESIVQLHWKEKHANGSYSMIGAQSPLYGTHTMSPYKEVAKLSWKANTTYILEVKEDMEVCCEMVIYPYGRSPESCVTMKVDTETQHFKSELMVVFLVGGFFFLGSFVILCYICWTRNRGTHRLREDTQQNWKRRGMIYPYQNTVISRHLSFDPLSMENHTDRNALPQRNAHCHRPLPQRNQLPPPPPVPPPRNWQHQPTMLSKNQRPSEENSSPDLPYPTIPTHKNFWTHEIPKRSNDIYSNVLRKKPKMSQPSWCSRRNTPTFDIMVHSRPLWSTSSYCPEEVAPLQPTISSVDSPFSTINPMYHSGAQWVSRSEGNI
ncbi:Hypothetical predicted protein [Pelobates cultripes]|uniref:Ig-like domain-containing protein n=1 Tax=Pelobates cultripes TaxID=61616 RepID=A0AAD1VWC7_PELCU|nr:Hypothetical predicted protein [Pelobates cultripes]